MDRVKLDFEFKFAGDAKDGTFAGYGAVFGNKDSYGDVIERGAMKDTLREWEAKGKWPPMLLQHGGFMGGASDMLPVGKWTSMEENTKGLKVEGTLFALATERGQYIYEGLKAGELDGLSIGYRVKAEGSVYGTKPNEPRRTIKALDLVELSIVTFPANDKARIGGVKAADIKTIREFEDFLRDAGGFSHAAAKAIAARGYKSSEPRDEDGAMDLLRTLRAARAGLPAL